jgi:hypothetical protein
VAFDRLGATADNVRLDAATAATIRGELERYREAVRIARTLVFFDRGRHELEIGRTVVDTPLSETQGGRTVARLLEADAAMRAEDGEVDGALDSCRAIVATARSIGDEPFMVSQLVRYAIGLVAMKSTRRVLAQGEPSDRALARLQALILVERDEPLLLHGLRGERAMFVEVVRRLREGELSLADLSDVRVPVNPGGFQRGIAPWGKLMFDSHRALTLEWFNRAVAIAEGPPEERPPRWAEWEAEIGRVRRTWHAPFTASLPSLMMPAITSFDTASTRHQADLGATAILLAAERQRRRSGAWPGSVAAIDRDILPEPPVDPSTGEDYRMEHRDGRIVIYSIGANGVDEHGSYDPKKAIKGSADDVGAIGWDVHRRRQPATEADDGPGADPPTP